MKEVVFVVVNIYFVYFFYVFMNQLDCLFEDFCGLGDLLCGGGWKVEEGEEVVGFFWL